MMKYSFILLNGETEAFLTQLQELGVVDVTRSSKPIDEHSTKMLDQAAATKRVILKLEGIDYGKDADYEAIVKASETAVLESDLTEGAQKAFVGLLELEMTKTATEKDVRSRLPWGDFEKERLDQLEELGYQVRYYVAPLKKFNSGWEELYPLQIISKDNSNVWFVTVSPKGEEYSFPIDPVSAPEGSWKEAQAEVESINARIIALKGAILKYKAALNDLESTYNQELTDLDMYLAKSATETAAENYLNLLEGFAPVENDETLSAEFDKMGILYIKDQAIEEDNPPIRLKNNRFVKMFESLTGMYGMPNYSEYDPTPVVSVFFLYLSS